MFNFIAALNPFKPQVPVTPEPDELSIYDAHDTLFTALTVTITQDDDVAYRDALAKYEVVLRELIAIELEDASVVGLTLTKAAMNMFFMHMEAYNLTAADEYLDRFLAAYDAAKTTILH